MRTFRIPLLGNNFAQAYRLYTVHLPGGAQTASIGALNSPRVANTKFELEFAHRGGQPRCYAALSIARRKAWIRHCELTRSRASTIYGIDKLGSLTTGTV